MSDENIEHVWKLIEEISFCMLATWTGSEIHARPMSPHFDAPANSILFLTDARHHKQDHLEIPSTATLAFADPRSQTYVSLIGETVISNNRQAIQELWSTPAKAFWQSAEDPNIRVLKVTPRSAEYWDSPGTVASYASMMMAAMTGSGPKSPCELPLPHQLWCAFPRRAPRDVP